MCKKMDEVAREKASDDSLAWALSNPYTRSVKVDFKRQ